MLCFAHINTSLAQMEFSFISGINTFSFKKRCVLPLVPETPLRASKNVSFVHSLPHTLVIREALFPGLHCSKMARKSSPETFKLNHAWALSLPHHHTDPRSSITFFTLKGANHFANGLCVKLNQSHLTLPESFTYIKRARLRRSLDKPCLSLFSFSFSLFLGLH